MSYVIGKDLALDSVICESQRSSVSYVTSRWAVKLEGDGPTSRVTVTYTDPARQFVGPVREWVYGNRADARKHFLATCRILADSVRDANYNSVVDRLPSRRVAQNDDQLSTVAMACA